MKPAGSGTVAASGAKTVSTTEMGNALLAELDKLH